MATTPHIPIMPSRNFVINILTSECDATCSRNAFVFLAICLIPKAVEWLLGVYVQISGLDELLQMSIIRLDCRDDSAHQARYIRCIFELLNACSHTAKYETATLTQNLAVVKSFLLHSYPILFLHSECSCCIIFRHSLVINESDTTSSSP